MKHAFSLRGGPEFQRAWDEGKSWSHPLVILRARSNGMPTSRFGFVAGKKLGTVVARNRAKRLMREVLRHRLPQIAPGWDIIMIARGGAQDTTLKEIDTAIEIVLQRAHLIK
ncbi:Ribonuclease P protein component [Anaerolineae bacterium]|nr:Ribonuclease P protein component [Anaerolineae bacterium]